MHRRGAGSITVKGNDCNPRSSQVLTPRQWNARDVLHMRGIALESAGREAVAARLRKRVVRGCIHEQHLFHHHRGDGFSSSHLMELTDPGVSRAIGGVICEHVITSG